MKLLNLFGRREKERAAQGAGETDDTDLELYSGMRVEVTAPDGRLLFVAKLLGLRGDQGELHPYSEPAVSQESEPLPVKIRGYSDHDRKAVCMEGVITRTPRDTWAVEELTVSRISNDRAFFRLETNINATATMFSGLSIGEKSCKLLNISIGGACIASEHRYHEGDKFLLKVRLLEDRPESAMYSQVVRVIERKGRYEYGCRFLELTEDDQERITQNIFTVQRQQRNRS